MKKNIIVILLVLLLVGAGVYFLLTNKSGGNQLTKNLPQVVNQKKQETIEKINDLITQNINIKCTYQTPEGIEATSYIKGKNKIRVLMKNKDRENEVLFLDGKMYSWNNKTKQGMVTNINQYKEPSPATMQNPQEYIDQLKKLNARCWRENFSDEIFQLPADIKFQDLDKIQEMMEKGNYQPPINNQQEQMSTDEEPTTEE